MENRHGFQAGATRRNASVTFCEYGLPVARASSGQAAEPAGPSILEIQVPVLIMGQAQAARRHPALGWPSSRSFLPIFCELSTGMPSGHVPGQSGCKAPVPVGTAEPG